MKLGESVRFGVLNIHEFFKIKITTIFENIQFFRKNQIFFERTRWYVALVVEGLSGSNFFRFHFYFLENERKHIRTVEKFSKKCKNAKNEFCNNKIFSNC